MCRIELLQVQRWKTSSLSFKPPTPALVEESLDKTSKMPILIRRMMQRLLMEVSWKIAALFPPCPSLTRQDAGENCGVHDYQNEVLDPSFSEVAVEDQQISTTSCADERCQLHLETPHVEHEMLSVTVTEGEEHLDRSRFSEKCRIEKKARHPGSWVFDEIPPQKEDCYDAVLSYP